MLRFVVLLFLLFRLAPGADQELLRLEASLDAMGSVYSVVLYGPDRGQLEAAAEEAFDEVRRLDRLLSNYRQDSEWSRVNQKAAVEPVPVSEELFDLIAKCLGYSRASQGAFDITVGPLMKVWGFYKGSGRLPHRAEVRGALTRVGYRHIQLDSGARTIRFDRGGVEMDPGGIGKGYAVDRMVALLKKNKIRSALVSAGGSSIYALGTPPDQDGWEVDIRDPKEPSQPIEKVLLKDQSLSSSGNYEKFFIADGQLYSHIMNPRTGYPAEGVLTVSVIAPQTLDSEAWTKPVYINGADWAKKNLPAGFRAFVCAEANNYRSRSVRRGLVGAEARCGWLQ